MFSHVASNYEADKPTAIAFRKMLVDNLVDRDISAQEASHLLLKLPLSLCSRSFVTLNVNPKHYLCITISNTSTSTTKTFISAYMQRPENMENMSLIEVAQNWTFKETRKKNTWKNCTIKAIIQVSPRFISIPTKDDISFSKFYRIELLLYCPFYIIQDDTTDKTNQLMEQWEAFKDSYNAWHVHRTTIAATEETEEDTSSDEEINLQHNIQSEWQALSSIHPRNPLQINELDMLGKRDMDINHSWGTTQFNTQQQISASTFIEYDR